METFKERLVKEEEDLTEKIHKLDKALLTGNLDIDDTQKTILRIQLSAMYTYLVCLRERIERLI